MNTELNTEVKEKCSKISSVSNGEKHRSPWSFIKYDLIICSPSFYFRIMESVTETLIGVRCLIGGCGEAKAWSAELFLALLIRPHGIKNCFAIAEVFSIHS